jgi:two-component system, cell cycle sensor histidine kinase and response regulator CckA
LPSVPAESTWSNSIVQSQTAVRRPRVAVPYVVAGLTLGAALTVSALVPGVRPHILFLLPIIVVLSVAWGDNWAPGFLSLGLGTLGVLALVFAHAPQLSAPLIDPWLQALRFGAIGLLLAALAAARRDAIRRLHATLEALSETRRFRAIIEHSSDSVALFAPDGRVLYASPATTRTLGCAPADLLGRSVFDIVHPDDRDAVRDRLEASLRSPAASVVVTARMRYSDGTWRETEGVFTNLLQDPSVRAVVNNFRDVSERRQLEAQLMQSQKMEAVGRLAGGVAHDFNNMLTVILAHANMAVASLPPYGRALDHLHQIEAAAERSAGLTRQLLAFARHQIVQPEVVDINELIQRVSSLLRRVIGEDIQLVTRPVPRAARVKVDPVQFEQVLVNLAVNARDAMPGGGVLSIETALTTVYETPSDPIAPGRYVVTTVIDTGVGITDQVLPHIFEPFYSTKEQGKGTGLGLATSYGIIRQHGGHINATSIPGQGTVFRIFLPQTEGAAAVPQQPSLAPARERKPATILLAEDDPGVRAVTRAALEDHGHTVVEAASAEEALARARDHAGPIDLLLTDVVMPGTSGRELADRLAPDLKVLYMSGYTDDAAAYQDIIEAGVPFLQKPFTPEQLADKVSETLENV